MTDCRNCFSDLESIKSEEPPMTEITFRTVADYQLIRNGYITQHQGILELTLPSSGGVIQASRIALDAVMVASGGKSTITNLKLQVSIVHNETELITEWPGEVL